MGRLFSLLRNLPRKVKYSLTFRPITTGHREGIKIAPILGIDKWYLCVMISAVKQVERKNNEA